MMNNHTSSEFKIVNSYKLHTVEDAGRLPGTNDQDSLSASCNPSGSATMPASESARPVDPTGLHSFVQTLVRWDDPVNETPRVSSLKEVGSRPHIFLSLNGVQVKALVDTGANISLLHDKFREQMSIAPCQLSGPTPIRDANTGSAKSMGRFAVTVKGENLDTTANFHVMKNLCSDAIIGTDFLALNRCQIDFQKNTVSFHGQSEPVAALVEPVVQPETAYRVETTKRVTIPDGKTVLVKVKIVTPKDVQFRPGATVLMEGDVYPHLFVIDGLYTVQTDNFLKIPVKNQGFKALKLKRRENLSGITVRSVVDLGLQEATPAMVAALAATGKPPPGTELLPGPGLPEKLKYIKDNLDLSEVEPEWREAYLKWAVDNHDVFSGSKLDIGHTPHYEHTIAMKSHAPIFVPQFRIPMEHQSILDEFVKTLMRAKVLIECNSVHNVPIFLVDKPKSDGKRVVCDFRAVNRQSFDDKYSIRDVRESLNAVGKNRPTVFSGLDLSCAFYQLGLAKDAQEMTAFTLPHTNKQYCWTRCPMGLKGAPSSFSKLIGIVLRDLGEGVTSYIDDVLCSSQGHEQHLQLLTEVAKRLRLHGLLLNPGKTTLGRRDIPWLGFHLSEEGISADKDKLKAVANMSPPDCRKKIQQYLGLFNYFRCLIENFSIIAQPLSALTSVNAPWKSTEKDGPLPRDALEAFRTLQQRLCSSPVVGYPILGLDYVIAVDASLGTGGSPGGIGAVLSQKQNNQEVVISYFSRSLRDHEKNYTCFATELLAAEQALLHFSPFVKGSRTTIVVDHKPVANHSQRAQKTISVLQEKIAQYDATVVYRRGELNGAADCLSRNSLPAPSVASLDVNPPELLTDEEWKAAQASDAMVVALINFVEQQVLPDEGDKRALVVAFGPLCVIEDGLLHLSLIRKGRLTRRCLFVPKSKRLYVLRLCHGSKLQGHWGLERTIESVYREFFWFELAQDVAAFVQQCDICQRVEDPNAVRTRTELHPWPQATRLFERVHVDLVGPLRSSGEFKYICAFIDAFSKFVVLRPLTSKDTKEVAQVFFEHFLCLFSTPKQLVSDRGGEFCSRILKELLQLTGVKKHVVSALNPQGNGQVEIFNKSLKKFLRCFVSELTDDWEAFLAPLQLAHNTSLCKSTHTTPYSLMFNQEPSMPWSLQLTTYSQTDSAQKFRMLQYTRQMAIDRNVEARKAYTRAYNEKASSRNFSVGDKVLVHYPSAPPGINPKLYRPWKGWFRVSASHGNDAYTVSKPGGRPTKVKAARLKHYHEIDDPLQDNVDLSLDDLEEDPQDPEESPHSLDDLQSLSHPHSGGDMAGGPDESHDLDSSRVPEGPAVVPSQGADSRTAPMSHQGWPGLLNRKHRHRPPPRHMTTRSMAKQAQSRGIKPKAALQSSSVMHHPVDDADLDLLILRNKVRFRHYLQYLYTQGFTLTISGQVVKVPEFTTTSLTPPFPSATDRLNSVQDHPPSLDASACGNKGGRDKGTAKSSAKFAEPVSTTGSDVGRGHSPGILNNQEGSNPAGQPSGLSDILETSGATSAKGSSSAGSPPVSEDGESSGSYQSPLQGDSESEQTPVLSNEAAQGVSDAPQDWEKCQAAGSSFWDNCRAVAHSVVPVVLQGQPLPEPASSKRETRFGGVPQGHYGSNSQIFTPNTDLGGKADRV